MKYLFLAASLFILGPASAQSGSSLPNAHQTDSAINVGRGLVSAKLADLKSAYTSNNAALFSTYSQQYLTLMRDGLQQRGRKLDVDSKSVLQANLPAFLKIERTFADYRNLLAAPQPDRAEIIKKAELFQSLY